MLLTDISRADFEQLFPHERLPGNTPGQLHDREALWQMVQQDKARGYVIGESFFRHGISSIVYPVYDRSGAWRRWSAFWCRRRRSRATASGCRTRFASRQIKFLAS
jgi:DNA-binding IclR family transcriptional regulator